jgi:hypothetical protein
MAATLPAILALPSGTVLPPEALIASAHTSSITIAMPIAVRTRTALLVTRCPSPPAATGTRSLLPVANAMARAVLGTLLCVTAHTTPTSLALTHTLGHITDATTIAHIWTSLLIASFPFESTVARTERCLQIALSVVAAVLGTHPCTAVGTSIAFIAGACT